ncbi:hypothetical protein [Bradyrhizobium sp. USDA 4452]
MGSRLLACIVLFAVAMAGVRFAAHGIVDHFGVIGGLVTIGAMIFAAHLYDQRQRERP